MPQDECVLGVFFVLLMSKETNQLRDYQKETIACVYKEWKTCRSVMVQMPTGTGKTHVLAHIVNEMAQGKVVLIVAHRVELVAQINETVDVFRSFADAQDDKRKRMT